VDTTSLTLGPAEEFELSVSFSPVALVDYKDTIFIVSDDFDQDTIAVPLHGVGIDPPIINIAESSLDESLLTGQISTQSITIGNDGSSNLTYSLSIAAADVPPAPVSLTQEEKKEFQNLYQTGTLTANSLNQRTASSFIATYAADLLNADSTIVYSDDFEGDISGWSHYGLAGSIDQWAISTARSSSGTKSWNVSQHAGAGADALESPSIDLTVLDSALLYFKHWYNFDDCQNDSFIPDGGIVEVSTDDGSSWTKITPIDFYPYVLQDICSNPLANTTAYARDGGDLDDFIPALFDLTQFAGNQIKVRFHAGWDCGNCDSNEGWFIDDFTVYSKSLVSWLSLDIEEGVVSPGAEVQVTATFDATDLDGGLYQAVVNVENNDPLNPAIAIPISLDVTGIPIVSVDSDRVVVETAFIGQVIERTLTISNTGSDLLEITDITSNSTEFSVDTTLLSIQPKTSYQLTISYSPNCQ